MEICPYSYFWYCNYLCDLYMLLVTSDDSSLRFTKFTSRISASWTHSLPLWFCPFWLRWHNSLKLSFINIWDLLLNFARCEPFLEYLLWNSCSMWDKLAWLNLFWYILFEGLSSFNRKGFCYSYTWSRRLCKGETSFCTWLISPKLWVFLFLFLTGFSPFSVLFAFALLITFFVHLT